ncbi:Lantibiotic biosynthesis dehydratase C-term [Amycolatopsis xylanica]|uniref:Lantibiotic biosynthesis dehydratase C-term n=1 Tax=Amycolatopsis xylanica TaxID=589385 RepID=A0A1H3P8W7_9PSEU|nr:lantibiotic dehydratase C-terminal domain-containing protein [Amycolatopsis xylanica]SDY97501.1 Lantibiotic biosynthesis dehydratase C-term [Amycolatopsis xylanica]
MDVICHYHHPVKAPLLREAILPIAEELAGAGLGVHLERHWLHGPHIRIALRDAEAESHAAEAAVRLRKYLSTRPSTADIDTATLLAEAAEAGPVELLEPPYEPIWPDNTVRVEPARVLPTLGPDGVGVRTELLRLGVPAVRAACEFLGDHGDSAASRLQIAMVALTAHAARYPAGLTAGYHSYLSHLEDFLANDDPDGRLAAQFEAQWNRHRAQVLALVERVTDGEEAWTAWSGAAWRHVESRLEAGADLSGGAGRRRERFSEYHQLMHQADPEGAMRVRPDILTYRWCTNMLYQLLMLCDLRPLERYLAAYLVTRAVPVLTGHDWRAEMATAIRSRR